MSGKRWGRRLGATIAGVVLITIPYYIVMFSGYDLSWWSEYAKNIMFLTGLLVGGLTVTDAINESKKGE